MKADGLKHLTKDQVQEYKEAFRNFDQNGDGSISCKELRTFLKSMGQNPSDADVKKIMKRVDKDESGTIDFSEFIVMMSEQTATPSSSSSEDFREAFKEFDKDGNGIITVKEFKKAMAKCGEKMSDKKVKEMMKKVDEDGDGCINYKEFVRMMTHWFEERGK